MWTVVGGCRGINVGGSKGTECRCEGRYAGYVEKKTSKTA